MLEQSPQQIAERHLWIHDSPRSDLYERGMFRTFVQGDGCWLTDSNGERFFDWCSSMWQAPLGHGREDIPAAFAAQARKVASAGPICFTTEGALELAERIARLAPGDLNRTLLTSSGSEATEAALKLARQYHRLRGDHHRYKFVSRYGSYHGTGMGGTSVSGRRRRDQYYYPMLPGCVHIPPPNGQNDLEAAEALRNIIEMEGPETIAAFFGEPVAITQFAIPGPAYWQRVRQICDEYGVLLIADETLFGCCRSGRFWGIENWDVVPDIMIVAKSLAAGYAPIAAMVVRDELYQAFPDSAPSPIVQSYGGHGAAAAAGAKALEIYERDNMPAVAEAKGRQLEAKLAFARKHPAVKDLRRVGLWLAIELANPDTGESMARGLMGKWTIGPEVSRQLLALNCAAARMSEGLFHIAPPLIVSETEMDFIAEQVQTMLDRMGQVIPGLLAAEKKR